MRIGVLSDTHGYPDAVDNVLLRAGEIDCWIHLGDGRREALALQERTGQEVYYVRGNCDSDLSLPMEQVVTLGGCRLFMTHGHSYQVQYDLFRVSMRAQELDCRAALFGHTHIARLEHDGYVLLLNPGSTSRPRGYTNPSFAVLTIEEGIPKAEIILLNK